MAQTTRFASFGPVLVIATNSNPIRRLEQSIKCIRTCNKYNILVKTLKKKRKDLHMAQMTCFVSFGPVLVIATHSNPLRRLEQSIESVTSKIY